jgi:hypothetical protein
MSKQTGERRGTGVRLGRRGTGYFAEGPHFYVWDEDPGTALGAAGELVRLVRPRGFHRAGHPPGEPRGAMAVRLRDQREGG